MTTFNALRNSGARRGDLVAVLGPGRTGASGRAIRREDGLSHRRHRPRPGQSSRWPGSWAPRIYIDSQAQDPAAELHKLGGAKVILATVTSGEAMSAVQGGLGVNGTLLIIGAGRNDGGQSDRRCSWNAQSVKGWYSGTSIDSQDTLAFSARSGVRSMNEVYSASNAWPKATTA